MRNPNSLLSATLLGLLASLSIAADPPAKKPKKLTLQDLLKSTTSTSKHSATVAGVRGLEETTGEIDTKARNFVAVEKLEKLIIHEDELKQFLDQGKLK